MGYYSQNCDELLPVHNCDPCEPREFGRVRSAGFIHKDYQMTDPADAFEWLQGIYTGAIILIPETNGSVASAAPKVAPGYGDTVETLLGYDFTAKVHDPNYVSNAEFYNRMVGLRNLRFFYRTSGHVHITNVPVTVIPNTEVKDDLNSEITWHIDVKWIDQRFAEPVLTPEGVFDNCYIPTLDWYVLGAHSGILSGYGGTFLGV